MKGEQFARVKEIGRKIGPVNPNGANLISFYGTPLENTFGRATLFMRDGRAVGFYDIYNFNIVGSSRSFKGQVKTIVGGALGAGGTPFETKFPC